MKLNAKAGLNIYKEITFLLFFILVQYTAAAQMHHRVFTFSPGDEFQKEIRLNSTCVIQRGKQRLDISSSSALTKSYKVTAVSDTVYDFMVTIEKIDDKINSQGKELHFNSENANTIDTTSRIHNVLRYLMGKPSAVSVNKNGIILSAVDANAALASDTLFAFAGLPEEPFIKGTHFGLIADFSTNKALKKGYAWKASSGTQNQQMTTNFLIDEVTDKITVIKFKSTIKGVYLNSNSNGTYILDNKSGLIIQRLVESISTGYQLQNKILYATTRRISLAEDCVKIARANASLKQ